jgi:lipoprotein-anchoring transpeptidase ErfK/SrfK
MSCTTLGVPRLPGCRRGVSALAVAFLTAGVGCVLVSPARAAGSTVRASQPLVVLLDNHVARTRPSTRAHRMETVRARRPLTGVRTVLPFLGEAVSSSGRRWLHVRLPGRPNGHHGWIPASETRRTATEWHVALKLSSRLVTVYRDGRAERRFRAVVGNPSTPTPQGRFFVEEALALSPQAAGGPFALATSARSNVLQEFAGGPGQVALHGTNHLSDPLGSAASHGCIRLSTGAITWLARRIGSGVPLSITQ